MHSLKINSAVRRFGYPYGVNQKFYLTNAFAFFKFEALSLKYIKKEK